MKPAAGDDFFEVFLGTPFGALFVAKSLGKGVEFGVRTILRRLVKFETGPPAGIRVPNFGVLCTCVYAWVPGPLW